MEPNTNQGGQVNNILPVQEIGVASSTQLAEQVAPVLNNQNESVFQNEDTASISPIPASSDSIFIRFFDSHPRWALFFFVLTINSLGTIFTSISKSMIIASILNLFMLVVFITIIVTNYRNKRRDAIMTFLTLMVLFFVIALIGFGFCLLLLSGLHN